ncbi:MAG TPA: ADP-ribosylglycohydrolase family protein [Acidimicrobiia bacterium]
MSEVRNRAGADGTGALLGLAAGDQLAALQRSPGAGALYGFSTQVATIAAYHLMRTGAVDATRFGSDLVDMAVTDDGPSAYRDEPAWFLHWLAGAKSGNPVSAASGIGAAPASLVVGIWYRWQAEELISEAAALAGATHADGLSVSCACLFAGAVAAASFGQTGNDYLNGVGELAAKAASFLENDWEGPGEMTRLRTAFGRNASLAGGRAQEVVARCTEELGEAGLVLAAVILGSVGWDRSEDVVRSASTLPAHSETVAPLVGGIVGSRRGLAHWPWAMPNEHWFAEIGRRLVARSRTYEDLPDPYAVEVSMIDPSWAPHRIF